MRQHNKAMDTIPPPAPPHPLPSHPPQLKAVYVYQSQSVSLGVQGISLDQIEPLRILFGWFPTYKDSPLKTPFDRVLQIGDASGIQSPLSFGGFGAMARHLSRLRRAVQEALQVCYIMPSCLKHCFFTESNKQHKILYRKGASATKNTH